MDEHMVWQCCDLLTGPFFLMDRLPFFIPNGLAAVKNRPWLLFLSLLFFN